MNISEETLKDVYRAFKNYEILEDIREEIANLKGSKRIHGFSNDFVIDIILGIFDKHMKEIEE